MSHFKPFIVPVNEAGIPHTQRVMEGRGNVVNLSPQEVANFYWLLESIEIRLNWQVGGKIFSKQAKLTVKKSPLERIVGPAMPGNSWIQVGPFMRDEAAYSLQFFVYLEDPEGEWVLTTEAVEHLRLIDKKRISDLKEMELKLWSNKEEGVITKHEILISYQQFQEKASYS